MNMQPFTSMTDLRIAGRPDIYITGAQKSGTTTLFDWLATHPEISARGTEKDFAFFSDDVTYRENQDLFASFFPINENGTLRLGGDANAMYHAHGAERMAAYMPDGKLIVALRDPVKRAYSSYCYAVERGYDERSFLSALEEELAGISLEPTLAAQLDYIEHGRYHKQLTRLIEHFGTSQVHVILFEELKDNPQRVMRDLCQFLGIDPDHQFDTSPSNVTRGGYRYKWLTRAAFSRPQSAYLRKAGRALIPFSVRTGLRKRLAEWNRVDRPKPEFDKASRDMLTQVYQHERVELESLLERSITCWSI